MTVNIQTKNLTLTDAISDYVAKQFGFISRLTRRFESLGAVSMDIELARTTRHHRKGEVFYAEVNLHLSGRLIRAEDSAEDLYRAINMVRNTLKRELARLLHS